MIDKDKDIDFRTDEEDCLNITLWLKGKKTLIA